MKGFFRKIKRRIVSLPIYAKILIIVGLFLLVAIVAAITIISSFAVSKFNKIQVEEIPIEEIEINEEVLNNEQEYNLGMGYTNFVLFGSDSRTCNVESNLNTDSIIVISLNNETKEIKMVSVYRDTLLDVGNGNIQKCNSAYARGGAKNAINMLNRNLDLNIQYYVTVDFSIVVDIVDMLGGVEIDITEAERNAINDYMGETARVSGKAAIPLEECGVQLLDGVQAVTYARIRKGVGDDYARTERQRLLIQKIAEKIMASDLTMLNAIIDAAFPRISTNLTMVDIIKYASCFTEYTIGENTGFPFEKSSGNIKGRGSCVYTLSLANNIVQLHEFLYGIEDYQPSSKVQELELAINKVVQSNKPSSTTTTNQGSSNTQQNNSQQNENSSTETIDATDSTVSSEQTESDISTEITESKDPETPTESTEPDESTESTEPDIDSTEHETPTESTESTESTEDSKEIEDTEKTDENETTETTELEELLYISSEDIE